MSQRVKRLVGQAVALHKAGKLDEAAALYRDVLEVDPDNPNAWHLAGVIEYQSGRQERALEMIGRAIRLDGRHGVFFNNYGAALQAIGRIVEALCAYQRAVALKPDYPDGHSNLGHMLEQLGDLGPAETSLRRALDIDPRHFDSLRRLGNLLVRRGRRTDAAPFLEQALDQQPENGELLAELGNCWLSDNRPKDAVALYRRALAKTPQIPAVHFNLGSALADQDELEDAAESFATAVRLAPHRTAWRLRPLALCPGSFASSEALDRFRSNLESRLDELLAEPVEPVSPNELMTMGFYPPFALSFQGRPNRRLKEKFAALVRRWIPQGKPPAGSGAELPRIGFVVTRGHEGLFHRCAAEIVRKLDPKTFDVVILCPDASVGILKQCVAGARARFLSFPETLSAARVRIEEARCDILYYWEVGTDSLNYLLPFFRLAPVQITSWGTIATSGVREIDHYLSSDLIEAKGSEDHYTEQLWRMRGLMTYQRRLPTPPPTTKAYFGLDPNQRVYLCPQTLMKLHPDQDDLFAEILRKDRGAVLVLKESKHPRSTQVVRDRMARTMTDVLDRIRFLPFQPAPEHFRLITVADAILDPLHFTAGSSSYDMWSFGQPIVTLPGQFNVGRYTLACYRRMELMDLVAQTPQHYVELAVRLANDGDFRSRLRRELVDRVSLLFEDMSTVEEHQEVLLQLYTGMRPK